MADKSYIIDGVIVTEDTSTITASAETVKSFFNSDFGIQSPTDSFGFLKSIGDCDNVGFVTASYKAVAGEFVISTDNTVIPSFTTTNKKFKLIVNGTVTNEVTQATDYTYTVTGLSKLVDTTFTPLEVTLVVTSDNNKEGCTYSYTLTSLERETVTLSNNDRLFTVTYSPTNSIIDSSLTGVTADWTINPYPEPTQQLPLHLLSYDLTENFLRTLTNVPTVSFKVEVLGKSLGSVDNITIKSNLYNVNALFNTVINGFYKYVNITIQGTAPFTLLFIDNNLLPQDHTDAIQASNKMLQVMVLDNQTDVDYFTTKGSFDSGDITRYINTVDFTIPTYTLDTETYELIDGTDVNNNYTNSSNPLLSLPFVSYKNPTGITIGDIDGEISKLINSTVSLRSVDSKDKLRIVGALAIGGELTSQTTLKRDSGTDTVVSVENLGTHIDEVIDNELSIDILSLLDLASYTSTTVASLSVYLEEHLTDGGFILKDVTSSIISHTITADPLYYVSYIQYTIEVTTIASVAVGTFISLQLLDTTQTQVKISTLQENNSQLAVVDFDGSPSTLLKNNASKFITKTLQESDNVASVVFSHAHGGGKLRVNNLRLIYRKRG